MTLEAVKQEAKTLFNDLVKLGLNSSYRSVLNTMYEEASRKKHYFKCSLIEQLIIEDINS
jgi:hypothetical protein